ncbi:hypothetical protein NM208_g11144 [Fusarium decemcellulare]|uniref:Uncharacterized protein n=1 Tax=Fusarium decemcellulare TaxID=57161 RepID=A0ACC1RVC6_9HYPO|nr:hypothetical protein NM208_g11144 [Fusarium decemcellulare]
MLGPRRHRSRAGCITCKKRKVKCDELRPTCNNCLRFRVPCVYEKTTPETAHNDQRKTTGSRDAAAGYRKGRRGPGRPRKDWDLVMANKVQDIPPVETTDAAVQCSIDANATSFGNSDVELLLHFTAHTASSLMSPGDYNHPMSRFWAHNVPRIALSFPFVMPILLSLAARHLAHMETASLETRRHHISLAHRHLSTGLAETTRTLPNLHVTNCGALYLSSVLVCYSSFAVGPDGPRDLLICHVNNSDLQLQPHRPRMPLIRGVRLISETFPREVLFSGLMAPLGPNVQETSDFRPSFIQEGFDRLDWVAPLDEIRRLVEACEDEIAAARLHSFNLVAAIYEATYGRDEAGACDVAPHHRFLFIWLYLIDDDFIAGLQRQDSVCLLILAYWALLLKTYARHWFMDGWTVHLLVAVRNMIDPDFASWLRWPLDIAGVEMDKDRPGPRHWDATNRQFYAGPDAR